MENKFNQLNENIKYDTLETALVLSSFGLLSTSYFLSPYSSYYALVTSLGLTASAGLAGCVLAEIKDKSEKKEQLRKLYEEFLENYNKLNLEFDLKNPVQIYTMFNYLLYKGYLSKNNDFEFNEADEIRGLLGATITTGRGVCRHISAMLTDILKTSGFDANQLAIYSRNYRIGISRIDYPKYTKEELIDWAQKYARNSEIYQQLMEIIEEIVVKRNINIELYSEMVETKELKPRILGNHAITFVVDDKKNYFLDPTQFRIYTADDSKKDVLYNECFNEYPVRLHTSILMRSFKDYLTVKRKIANPYPSVSREEANIIVEETKEICRNNDDIFEKFYNENAELYDEISNKLLKYEYVRK